MASPRDFPRRINVEPTNHCNQRCRLCPRQEFTRPLGFMTRRLFADIARQCAGHDTTLWLHFLGEPLLHRDLIAMIGDAKRAGVATVGLSTNAVSLHGVLAERLLDSGLDRLECSMDAVDRSTYAQLRGRDHFDRVRRNIHAFLERKRRLGLHRPLTSIQFLRTPETDATLARALEEWRPVLSGDDFVMTIEPAPFGGANPQYERPASGRERPPCAWLFESLMILQDGTVTMCGADWDARAPLGHLADSTIEQIWRGPEIARRRQAHLDRAFDRVGPCQGCSDWVLADGSGYANALAAGNA